MRVVGWFSLKRKLIRIHLSVLILLAVLGSTLILSLSPVFANPVCGATITTNTTLTANIGPCSGDGLDIGANSITLNCAGHTITGTSGNTNNGISIWMRTHVIVENCKVTGFGAGIWVYQSSGNTITGNTATKNLYDGFVVASSTSNLLTKNTANNNKCDGFVLDLSSSKNTLTGNTANSNACYGYHDETVSSSRGVPHWDTANSYGTTVAMLPTTGDKGTGNSYGLAGGNSNISTATSPF
jgi:parallel beta-helix repeat protein